MRFAKRQRRAIKGDKNTKKGGPGGGPSRLAYGMVRVRSICGGSQFPAAAAVVLAVLGTLKYPLILSLPTPLTTSSRGARVPRV